MKFVDELSDSKIKLPIKHTIPCYKEMLSQMISSWQTKMQ